MVILISIMREQIMQHILRQTYFINTLTVGCDHNQIGFQHYLFAFSLSGNLIQGWICDPG